MGFRPFLGTIGFIVISVSASFPSCVNALFDRAPQRSDDISQLIQKADQGDRTAQFRLGVAYESGVGAEKNYGEAIRWYRRAANAGHSGAQNNLGSMYGRGLGVAQNDVEAMKWYLRAAADGHPAAQFNAGSCTTPAREFRVARRAPGIGLKKLPLMAIRLRNPPWLISMLKAEVCKPTSSLP